MSKEQKLDTKEVTPYTDRQFPDSLLCLVTSFVDFDDRSRLLQSASCFKAIVGKKQSYPDKLDAFELGQDRHPSSLAEKEVEAFRAQVKIFGPVVKTLSMSCSALDDSDVEQSFKESCIYGAGGYSAREFFQSFPNLTSLTLKRMSSWDMLALRPEWKLVHLALDLHPNFTGLLEISSEEVQVEKEDYDEDDEEEPETETEDVVSITGASFRAASEPHSDALQFLTETVGNNYPNLESFAFTFEMLGLFEDYMNDDNGSDMYHDQLDGDFHYSGMLRDKKQLRQLTMNSFLLPLEGTTGVFDGVVLKEELPRLESLTTTYEYFFHEQELPTVTDLTLFGNNSYAYLEAFPNLKKLTVEKEPLISCAYFHNLQRHTPVQLTLNRTRVSFQENKCPRCIGNQITELRLVQTSPIDLLDTHLSTLYCFPSLQKLTIQNLRQSNLRQMQFWEMLKPGLSNLKEIQADNLSAEQNALLNADMHEFDILGKGMKAWREKLALRY